MTPTPRRSRARATARALLLAAAALLLPLAAAAQPQPQPLPVTVAAATELADDATIEVVGTGLARRAATLQPAIAGEVAEVDFKSGDRVRGGQPLLHLVDRAQRLAVDLAASRVDAARELLARYDGGGGRVVTASVVDEARSALRQAGIELAQAREELARTVLRAPFDGVVGLAEVKPGDRVTSATVIATIDDRRQLQVRFSVPESYLARLAVGQPLTVVNPAFAPRRFDGRVALIDSRVDAVTRQLRVQAEVPNAEDLLRPGMSFEVRLVLPGARRVAVPELALQWGREGAFVWAVREGRAARVPVRALRRLQGQVLVDGAIAAGETVVVEGVQRLREGRPVQIVGRGDAPG